MYNLEKLIDEATFSIGSGGMRRLTGDEILIQPNMEYYMGASSSPDHIVVTKVDDDWIYYKKYPYKKEFRADKLTFTDLIATGTRTWLNSDYPKYFPELAKALKKLLKGEPARYRVDPEDFTRIAVHLVPKEGADFSRIRSQDPWYAAEEYGGVSSYEDSKYGTVYITHTSKGQLDNIKRDGLFDIIKTKEESADSVNEALDKKTSYAKWAGDINFRDFEYPEDDEDVWDVYERFLKPLLKREYPLVSVVKDDKYYIYINFQKDRGGADYTTTISKHILFTMSPKLDAPIYANKLIHEVDTVLDTLYGEKESKNMINSLMERVINSSMKESRYGELMEIIFLQNSQDFGDFRGSGGSGIEGFFDSDESEMIEYLAQWDYGDYTSTVSEPWGTSDEVYEQGDYVMSYNPRLGYAGLYIKA